MDTQGKLKYAIYIYIHHGSFVNHINIKCTCFGISQRILEPIPAAGKTTDTRKSTMVEILPVIIHRSFDVMITILAL